MFLLFSGADTVWFHSDNNWIGVTFEQDLICESNQYKADWIPEALIV